MATSVRPLLQLITLEVAQGEELRALALKVQSSNPHTLELSLLFRHGSFSTRIKLGSWISVALASIICATKNTTWVGYFYKTSQFLWQSTKQLISLKVDSWIPASMFRWAIKSLPFLPPSLLPLLTSSLLPSSLLTSSSSSLSSLHIGTSVSSMIFNFNTLQDFHKVPTIVTARGFEQRK